jgi:hypothetical protein
VSVNFFLCERAVHRSSNDLAVRAAKGAAP